MEAGTGDIPMRFIRAAAYALALAVTLCTSAAAQSGSPSAPADPWAFTLGLTTDYVRHGTLRGQDDIEALASAQWTHGDIYLSAAANTAAVADSDEELDLALGWQKTLGGWNWTLSVMRALYFGGSGDFDSWQINAQAARTTGPVTWTLTAGGSPDYDGPVEAAYWTEAQASYALNKVFAVEAALGAQQQDGAPDYVWWQAGVTVAVTGALSLDLHWYDTDSGSVLGPSGDGQAVAALTFSF